MHTMGHSDAARAGMLNFTETAACEWAHCAIAPSGMDTYPPEHHERVRNLKYHVPLQGGHRSGDFRRHRFSAVGSGRLHDRCLHARHPWKLIAHERSKPYNGFPLATVPKIFASHPTSMT
jgi:citronellol/citronellal dehydrogenase